MKGNASMGRGYDLSGKRFGRLTVISKAPSKKLGYKTVAQWNCRCNCGNEIVAQSGLLMNGHIKSCGCLKKENRFKDLTGMKFGRLYVIEFLFKRNSKPVWKCKCDCGNFVNAVSQELISGKTKSCGCYRKDYLHYAKTTNGLSKTRVRSKWKNMMERCYNPSNASYKNYGGRGITVCEEWHILENFAKWAYESGFSESCGLTIDRIDVNGNYEPSNCRWADMKMQSRNRRNNRFVSYMGESKTVAEWAELSGVNRATISYRAKNGIPIFNEREVENAKNKTEIIVN